MLRRMFDKQVQVIRLAVAGEKFTPHSVEHLGCMFAQPRQGAFVQHLAPILSDADQMDGEPGNAVSLAPKLLHSPCRPIIRRA